MSGALQFVKIARNAVNIFKWMMPPEPLPHIFTNIQIFAVPLCDKVFRWEH